MPKIFVVGSLNMDLVMKTSVIPARGQTIEGAGFSANPGGKGANQAVACAKLGAEVYLVGCVGETFGDELVASAAGYGVNTLFVQRTAGPSGIAVILVTDGDNRILLERGANGKLTEEGIARALGGASEGDLLLLQLEIPLPLVSYAAALGRKRGMTVMLNPAPACELPQGLLSLCDLFSPNQTEAEFYTGIYPKDPATVGECARRLLDMGASNVLITLGTEGSAYVGREGRAFAEIFPAKAVDTTAAGDTYLGAFAVKRAEGASVEEAMRFASCASAITVTRPGAQQAIPVREEVEALLNV